MSYSNANMPYSKALYETICCKINPPFLPPPCVIDILARPLYLLSLESGKSGTFEVMKRATLRFWLSSAFDGSTDQPCNVIVLCI